MKKETIAAIIFGIIFGVISSLIFLQSYKKQPQPVKLLPSLEAPLTKKNTPEIISQNLEILSPENNSLFYQKEITIKGKAPKKSLIIIQSPIKDIVFENNNETFSVTFPLAYGANQINIYAYPKNIQTPLFKNLIIYYLENKL